ncbi:MAG: redoxin domain-containing protein [Caulobacter sp.]|nr:redoxin domain-containing protein [Caulobacter sp.]
MLQNRTRLILWAAVALGLVVTLAIAAGSGLLRPREQPAAVGGPFSLVDQTGRPTTEAALKGHWSMVFFGYTYCPDICPGTLQNLIRAKDQLGSKGKDVSIVFISVDPARDRPAVISDWLEANGAPAGTLGLTGTQDQVDVAVKAYKAVARKSGEGADYQMDHSTVVYLMNPRGRFVQALPYALPDEIVTQVKAAKRGD